MILKMRQQLSVWIIKKIQKFGPRKVEVSGKTYKISPAVLNPRYYFTSQFMAKHINVSPEDVVLDMGTGSGIQAITAGQTACRVVAVDINPEAVRYARKNVSANGLDDVVSVIQGDLFMPLRPHCKFNVILFTPPYMEGKPRNYFDHSLYDPDKSLIRRFFTDSKGFIKPGGYVQMLYSSIADPDAALRIARELGWEDDLLAREKTVTESFFIYHLRMSEER